MPQNTCLLTVQHANLVRLFYFLFMEVMLQNALTFSTKRCLLERRIQRSGLCSFCCNNHEDIDNFFCSVTSLDSLPRA